MTAFTQGRAIVFSWRTFFVISAAAAAALGFSRSAHSADEPELRLVQLDEETRQWMTRAELDEISHRQHLSGRCGGYMDITETVASGADELFAAPHGFLPASVVLKDGPTRQADVERLLPELSIENIVATVTKLSSFKNRKYNDPIGKQSAEWIFEQYQKIGQPRSDVSVAFFPHSWLQPSVIARIEGKGPRAAEVVVIGGHQDSISSGSTAPGADDDASGTATVLEIFRVLVESGYQPDRSIEFMAYAAEEVGLRGSQDITAKYRKDARAVVGAMQFDMTMFPGSKGTPKITFINDHVDPALTEFSKKLVDTYVKIPWGSDPCGYACSDHASWTRAKYPSVFPFEASFNDYNRNIHSVRDKLDVLDPTHGLHFAKLGLAFAIEMTED